MSRNTGKGGFPGRPALSPITRKSRFRRALVALEATLVAGVAVFHFGRAVRFRYRAQSWPLFILGALLVGRIVAAGSSPWSVFAVTVLTVGVVVFWLRNKLDRTVEWVYAWLCLTGAVTGLTLVSVFGTGHPVLNAVGWLWWAGLSTRWWFHQKTRIRPINVPAGRGAFGELWHQNIQCQGGPLPGAVLTGPVPFEHGDTYTIHLVKGKQSLSMAQSGMKLIESGVDTPIENLVIERHPDYPDRPSMLRLQHVTKSPIKETVWFDHPRYEDGAVLTGPYADGVGETRIPIYTENSVKSTLIVGGTGAGKSGLINTIVITLCDPGFPPTVVWYMDGQDGASSPTLFKHADWAVGRDKIGAMLAAAERIADRRNKENRAWGLEGFTPTEDRQGLIIVMDEFNQFGPQYAERLRKAATSWRKVGICFITADQDCNLTVFGGNDALRSALMSGGAVMMRVNSRITGNLLPGCPINPYDLPDLPGYFVRIGAPGSGIRTAPGRGRYAPDANSKTLAVGRGETVPVPSIEERFAGIVMRQFTGATAEVAGPDYVDRVERAERERAELLAYLDAPVGSVPTTVTIQGGDGEDDDSRSTATAILALPWSEHGELTVAQIVGMVNAKDEADAATAGVVLKPRHSSTFTKALRQLKRDGGLLQDNIRGPYRVQEKVSV